ncbi:hypothetical protein [Mammaliicoccus sciuri]|jgi:nucleotidyltransferase/DNA polymerase involved in DNA repair|uniref:hypothetical protein n=1 Tax=Mammaliicoccus sciuri TaxID=1296 RepID=UPI00195295C8|nr:hypothetical protein [Mammaliicoccus sciuri]MBO1208495.1 hypothetical protein [Mammaliicoccus sciuri]MCD8880795.1 hypothetical protein [Mammaliicoccus sciuri]MCJ0934343.1 hypothetical protein [Mammaliicoccus sciuri]MDO0956146.1 hypothetical protein [Mammaliicoccus sciuri]MEB8073444.1 hypothetical protein [Mammaliicoccus sciuri]
MDKIEKIYKKDISNLLKGVENSNVPVVNPIIADVLDKMNIDTNAKLATLSIDASMRFLNRIGEPNVSNQDILIGDLVSAYFYKCATLNKDLVFLDIMTQAISKQNELKQTLAHDKINKDTAIIKEIESIFITTVIDYYKINMDKENLKDQIYAYYY